MMTLHKFFHEGSFMIYIHIYDFIESKNIVKYPYSIDITKCEILIIDAQIILS